jgi:hypothetical protein
MKIGDFISDRLDRFDPLVDKGRFFPRPEIGERTPHLNIGVQFITHPTCFTLALLDLSPDS